MYIPSFSCSFSGVNYWMLWSWWILQKGTVLEAGGSEASFLMQSYTLTKRSFINMSRDFGYYWLRLVIYIVVTVCIGTIYLNVGTGYNSILVLLFPILKAIWSCHCITVLQEIWPWSLCVFFPFISGQRFLCIFRLWFCDLHVNWWIPFICWRHEGE